MRELPPAPNSTPVRLAQGAWVDARGAQHAGPSSVVTQITTQTGQLRRCSRCQQWKSIDEFPVKDRGRGTRRTYCRDCCRAYGREHYARNKAAYCDRARRSRTRLRESCQVYAYDYLLTHPCVDCGEADPVVLDFDHRDPKMKLHDIAWFIRRRDVAGVVAEIAKCEVRCANDHRRKTARDRAFSRWLARN
jgi:hypothetical protein